MNNGYLASPKDDNEIALVSLSILGMALGNNPEADTEDYDFKSNIKTVLVEKIPEGITLKEHSKEDMRAVNEAVYQKISDRYDGLQLDIGKLQTSTPMSLFYDVFANTIVDHITHVKVLKHELLLDEVTKEPQHHAIEVEIRQGDDIWVYGTLDGQTHESFDTKRNGSIFNASDSGDLTLSYIDSVLQALSCFISSEKIKHEVIASLAKDNELILKAKKTANIVGGDYRYYLIPLEHLTQKAKTESDFINTHAKAYIHAHLNWTFEDCQRVVDEVLSL